VRLTLEEALISALAIGVALGVTEYLFDGVALGILLGVGGFLVSFAIFDICMRARRP
jgi:hypothetical protein